MNVLCELRVENLLLIERAELRLGPGLNVLTGETGAGKTVLAHALDLLLGGRARSGIVRPGAGEAWVEGAFELSAALRERLGERIADDADELVLARRVGADGRTRAYVNHRGAAVGELGELGAELLAFYGQHEHRRLTLASAQLDVLDDFCGPEQRKRRTRHGHVHGAVRAGERELDELRGQAGARDRELDLLAFELEEIEAAAPSDAESEQLDRERERLRHFEALRAAALGAAAALAGAGEGDGEGAPSAAAVLGPGERALDGVAGVDPELDAMAERLRTLLYEAQDLAGDLRRYEEAIEASPGRLEEVEERLALLGRLARKHGGSLGAVLEHAERCRARRDELAALEVSVEEAQARLARARAERHELADALAAARRAAAPALAAAVGEQLVELAMPDARFDVQVTPRAEPGPTGADAVELAIAPNPGVPAGPLREIASGGELSRVMLAILSVAHGGDRGRAREAPAAGGARHRAREASADGAPDRVGEVSPGGERLLVFDEVDAGIGGRTARAVGARLRALAEGRQVLCITHLPQIASLADRHFVVAKDVGAATASATVHALEGDGLVAELARMLGADAGDDSARAHARELAQAGARG